MAEPGKDVTDPKRPGREKSGFWIFYQIKHILRLQTYLKASQIYQQVS